MEIASGKELSESSIMQEVHPKQTIVKPKFLKPKGPQNRRPKSPSKPDNGGQVEQVNGD